MHLSEKHRKLVEEIAGDAARAAGIRAADAAAREGLDDEDALAAGFNAYRARFSVVAEILEDWWDSK
jgi:hypothetical protein